MNRNQRNPQIVALLPQPSKHSHSLHFLSLFVHQIFSYYFSLFSTSHRKSKNGLTRKLQIPTKNVFANRCSRQIHNTTCIACSSFLWTTGRKNTSRKLTNQSHCFIYTATLMRWHKMQTFFFSFARHFFCISLTLSRLSLFLSAQKCLALIAEF